MKVKSYHINATYALQVEDDELWFFKTLEEVAHAAIELGIPRSNLDLVVKKVNFTHLQQNEQCYLKGYADGIKKNTRDPYAERVCNARAADQTTEGS